MNISKTDRSSVVKLGELDINNLILLSASVGWDYHYEELKTILSSGYVFGHKNSNGKIISSGAIIPYGTSLGSIGMVIVDEEYRGKGLGIEVVQTCINSVSNNTPLMLISTNAGKPLYEKMGFMTVDHVHKYICDNYIPENINYTPDYNIEIAPMGSDSIPEVFKLDKNALGADRGNLLINRIRQAKEALVAKTPDGKIIGYALSIPGPNNLVLGPIVASEYQSASLLVDRLSKNYRGKIRLDIPTGNQQFIEILENSGFNKVSQPPILIKNAKNLPWSKNKLFAIAAQVFG